MKNNNNTLNKENKPSLTWGEVYIIDDNVVSKNLENEKSKLNVVFNNKLKDDLAMEKQNLLIKNVASIIEDSNKLLAVDSYSSDTSVSNLIINNSTSEGSSDSYNIPQYYPDSNPLDITSDLSAPKLKIVSNNIYDNKFDTLDVLNKSDNYANINTMSSRTHSVADSSDTLDKMWNMKSFMNEMKTDYNTSEHYSDDDYKNSYINNVDTSRFDQTMLQSPSLEQADITVDYYKFEVEKLEKIVSVLKSQISSKDEKISKLSEKAAEYDHWRSELDPSRQASVVQYKAENEAFVAVNYAKLQAQVDENDRLTQRLMQMEETHRSKDDEIRSLREKILENEVTSTRFDRELKSLEIDKQMLKNSIESMEKTFRQRELQMKLNLDMEYQNQLSNILKEQEQLMSLVADKDSEIEKCKELLKTARHECSQLLNSIVKLKEILLKKNQEIDHYKNKVIELESSLIANDKTSELKISRDTQSKLRDKIRKLEQKLEMLEESARVNGQAKEENLYLRAKIEKLQKEEMREYSQSVMDLGNQILPLSLANLRDS